MEFLKEVRGVMQLTETLLLGPLSRLGEKRIKKVKTRTRPLVGRQDLLLEQTSLPTSRKS